MWSIVDVARASGVTARTLRHYDAIGLLPPAGTAENGYRQYGEDELLRLQQILVLRALGLPLAEIGAVLEQRVDRREALRGHHARLVRERDRLGAMAATVARTLEGLERAEGSTSMTVDRPEDLFEGFDESAYAKEAQQRWPEEYASTQAYVAALSPEDQQRMQADWTAQMRRMAGLMDAGAAPGDPLVQAEVRAVYDGLTRMWTPNAAAFTGLGAMYADDERFTVVFDRVRPGLAAYYRDAMAVFAGERLS